MSENPFDTMRQALTAARASFRAADEGATAMAGLLRGRLRHVDSQYLTELKRELRGYDAQRKVWK